MGSSTATPMDGIEIEEFLRDRRTGVLSLADDDDAYAIPVSFVYGDSAVYFRLAYAPDSQKRAFVDATEHASFVVYDDTDEGWKSVVIEGRLEELSHSSLDSSVVEAVNDLDIPFFQVHSRAAADLEFNIVRISPTSISGIVGGSDGR